KNKTSNSSSTDDIFSQLLSQYNAKEPGSAVMGDEMESEITHWIDSGSVILNMILSNKSDGGWPCGRIVHVYGPEGIGKSTLAYKAIANCQKEGGICIYADLEHAANKKFMSMIGVDLTKIIWTDIDAVEDLFDVFESNLTLLANDKRFQDKPKLIIIDSNAALMTKQELEGNMEFNMNTSLGKAKALHKVLRKISKPLCKANVCLFVIDQIKDNTSGYGPKYNISGGRALPFWSSIRVLLDGKTQIKKKDPKIENDYQDAIAKWKAAGGNKSGLVKPEKPDVDEAVVGVEVTALTAKNKTAPPLRTGEFRIIFAEGLDDAECFLDYLEKYGVVKKNGSWYAWDS